jgi:hypothetical protein
LAEPLPSAAAVLARRAIRYEFGENAMTWRVGHPDGMASMLLRPECRRGSTRAGVREERRRAATGSGVDAVVRAIRRRHDGDQ